MVGIEVDKKDLKRVEKLLREVPGGSKRACVNASNRAFTRGKVVAKNETKKRYTIKPKDINQTLSIKKSTFARLDGALYSKAPISRLKQFKTYPTTLPKRRPKMFRAEVIKGAKKDLPGVFLARMKSGHIGAFKRYSKASLPIGELPGPSIPYVIKSDEVSTEIQGEILKTFNARLDHEVNRLLDRL